MSKQNGNNRNRTRQLARFWKSASGYWKGKSAWRAWLLSTLLFAIVVAQLATQYWLNYWNRDFFNALEQKDAAALMRMTLLFFPLAALSIGLGAVSVWGRMTVQRNWRLYLTTRLIKNWLADDNFRKLGQLNGTDVPQNPEYRITEDCRIATDAPIDLTLALFSSILTVYVFFEILASVGGSLTINLGGLSVMIPAYLAVGVVAYSGVVTATILLIGRRFTNVVQDQVQAEAEFRAAANLIRETGEGMLVAESESDERRALWIGFHHVIVQWRRLCWQYVRATFVTHGNAVLVPTVGLLLCVPKFLQGAMSLGEVTQAAAAFVTVQGAFNWLVDNFQRMSDWRSSANRVAQLLLSIDDLN
jgi:ABC-type uncharacterized transport system fused permease/ATPase subunit